MHEAVPFSHEHLITLKRRVRVRSGEWMTSAMLITFGFMLSSRPDMFNSEFYAGLAWAPQSLWAAVSMIIGFARVSTLVINGAWRYSAHARALLAAASVFIWGGLVEGIWAFGRPTLGMALCPWLLIIDLCALWWASGDARDSIIAARRRASKI